MSTAPLADPRVDQDPAPSLSGLSAIEAQRRLTVDGPNEIARGRHRSVVAVLIDVLREPMLALLAAGAFVYLALGDLGEALILAVFTAFSIIVTTVQETRSERAIEALRDIASPRALVVRDGVRRRIAGREVVRGDLVELSEGDRIPADGWVVANDGLEIDESLLTGESMPVGKLVLAGPSPDAAPRPGGDGLPYVFSGTLVVRGQGSCAVAATGPRSEVGKIGKSLMLIDTGVPRLRRETRRLVTGFAVGAGAMTLLTVLLYGSWRGNWLEAGLAGIALGMSLLPEEFPVVLTIFMAMGAVRLSRVRVLARRAAAIETLGAATVLCTDKTGTLTENRMQIAEMRLPDGHILALRDAAVLPSAFHHLVKLGAMASAERPFDPMDLAFHELRDAQVMDHALVPGIQLSRGKAYPLRPDLLAVSHVWGGANGEAMVVACKGAPEAVAELCRLDVAARGAMHAAAAAMAANGLRVLGLAEARWSSGPLPADQRAFRFDFAGLVGLADPLRASVPDAVRQCRSAGIRVVMITGDHPDTARSIARQAGIDADHVVTGQMLADMTDVELAHRTAVTNIFARIMPEQKLRIVEALKAGGQVVGMTGDGVNDAPSLKAADIGIAMGGRGTDVAREAASIVLLDDDFGSIVTAIRLGRRIYDNLRKAMGFIIAVHVPIAGLAILPLLMGLPMLLGPIHIALLEMIIDPVCSLVFETESEEADIMTRPPRAADSRLLATPTVILAVVQGLIGLAVALGVIAGTAGAGVFEKGVAEESLRTAGFIGLVFVILGLMLASRSFTRSGLAMLRRPNLATTLVIGAIFAGLVMVIVIPGATRLLGFVAIDGALILGSVVAGLSVILVTDAVKSLWANRLGAAGGGPRP